MGNRANKSPPSGPRKAFCSPTRELSFKLGLEIREIPGKSSRQKKWRTQVCCIFFKGLHMENTLQGLASVALSVLREKDSRLVPIDLLAGPKEILI